MKVTKEFKIGVFVVAVLAVTFFVINFLRGKDLLGREMEVKSYFGNVEGLLPSAPVYIKGYKAGTVGEVEYLPQEGKFEVVCSIQKRFAVPEDSKMVIYGVDIMGGKGVRIDPGTSGTPAEDGAVLDGSYEPDLISSVSAGIGPLIEKAAGALDSISVMASGIDALIAQAAPQLQGTLEHLEKTMRNVENLSQSVNGKSAEIEALLENLSSVSEMLVDVVEKVDTTMANVTDITASLSESEINGLICSFRQLVDKIQDPDGSLGKLLDDGSVYQSVDSLLNDIDRLVKKIEENPKKYIRISIF